MRPFLVLLLVLAALAALVFGILSLLGDPTPQEGGPAPTAAHTAEAPTTPTTLEGGGESPEIRDTPSGETRPERAIATSGGDVWRYDNTLAGVVLNPQSQPVSGAEVSVSTAYELLFVNDPLDTSQDETVRTDGQGKFAFHDLEPRSRYKLTVKHPQFTLKELFSVPVGESGEYVEPPIFLGPGATLQGHVRDSGGNMVDGASLVLDGLMYQGAPYDPPDRMKATSDAQGFYSFVNVPMGQRMLTVSAPGYGTVTLNGLNFDKEEPPENREIELRIGEMIRGRVVCQGQGIPDAMVQALGFASTAQISRGVATTDATGAFTFESLTPGDYNLIANARGFRFEAINRQRTGSDNVVIEGFKEADVCGHVIDAATGAPVTSFTCRMRTDNGPDVPTSVTEFVQTFNDSKGEFCINGIPQGPYVIEAFATGYAPSFSAPISVARGQAPGGNVIRLTRGGSISGRVVDVAGKPVPRARITTHDREWSDDTFSQMLGSAFPSNVTQVDVRCDESGKFVLSGLTPDSYQMHIRAAGFTRYMKNEIAVTEGADTKLGDITLSRGGTLRGTLFDPSGKPLVGGTINVIADDGRMGIGYSGKSGSDGKFLIVNVAPGRYLVSGARGGSPESNPIEFMGDLRSSQKQVTITEENASVVDLSLTQ